MSYILIVFTLGFLILVHELGHLLGAKLAGIPVDRFSVGFGPSFFRRTIKETEYRVSVVPLGGYVLPRIEGEKSYLEASLRQKLPFTLAGPAANFAAALLCLSVMQAIGSGISFTNIFIAPLIQLVDMAGRILAVIPTLFDQPDQLSGVVGIVAVGGQKVGTDVGRWLSFCVLVNVNLAIFNLLPLPPLDGGKIVQFFLEAICKPAARLQIPIAVTGWILIIALLIYATILDVRQLIM